MNLDDIFDLAECYRIPKDLKARLTKLTLSKKKKIRQSLKASNIQISNVIEESKKNLILEMLTDDSSDNEAETINRIFLSESSKDSEKHDKKIIENFEKSTTDRAIIQTSQRNANDTIQKSAKFDLNLSDSDVTHCTDIEMHDSKTDNKLNCSNNKYFLNYSLQKFASVNTENSDNFDKSISNAKKKHEVLASLDTISNAEISISHNIENLSTSESACSAEFKTPESDDTIDKFLKRIKQIDDEKLEKSTEMEKLNVTEEIFEKQGKREEFLNKPDEIDKLSQKVNSMGIRSPRTNIGCMEIRRQMTIKTELEKTQVISVDSQRKSSGEMEHTAKRNSSKIIKKLSIIKKYETSITGENNQLLSQTEDIIEVSSNESSEEEESVVIVSDSDDEDINNTEIYDNHVSQIRPTGQTSIASTMSNFTANRIFDYIKDCKQHPNEYQVFVSNSNKSFDDTVDTKNIRSIMNKKENTQTKEKSFNSSDNSIISCSLPSDSVEISGTSTEQENDKSLQKESNLKKEDRQKKSISIPDNTKKKSLSKHEESIYCKSKQSYDSDNTYEEEEISISAKFNIKIKFTPTGGIKVTNRFSSQENVQTESKRDSQLFQENQNKKIKPKAIELIPQAEDVSIRDVDETAKKILTELYGTQWQTPEIIKRLDKKNSTPKCDKKKINKKLFDSLSSVPNESSMADFSTFNKNIPSGFESTRLDFQSSPKKPNHLPIGVQKRNTDSPIELKCVQLELPRKQRNQSRQNIKTTEKKGYLQEKPATPTTQTKKTKPGRRVIQRQLINDSSSEDARDDDTIFKTDEEDSWKASDEASSESDSDERTGKTKDKNKLLAEIKNKTKNGIVYLDLSSDVIQVQDEKDCASPAANHDPAFNQRLQYLLKTCTYQERKKLDSPMSTKTESKRRLFTPRLGYESENTPVESPINKYLLDEYEDDSIVKLSMPLPLAYPINKKIESVKTGTPIFKIPLLNRKEGTPYTSSNNTERTPKKSLKNKENKEPSKTPTKNSADKKNYDNLEKNSNTLKNKYGFLKSLDVEVPRSVCHPDALPYRDNFKNNKLELAEILYKMYNEQVFANKLTCPIQWNKKLLNTAGRCSNKRKGNLKTSVIELSEKVITSADRLRCTLIHEMCHSATWVINGGHGHGEIWKTWTKLANKAFPELPKIGVCHNYDVEYKYTYKCTLCNAKSHAHSKSKKVENIRCSYCHGSIEILLNKKDKHGNITPTPVKQATGFAKFVKENYKKFKTTDRKHADVMKLLSNEFSNLKVDEKIKY